MDYIFHLQPQNQSLPLAADWRKLVFSEIQRELPSAVRAAFKVAGGREGGREGGGEGGRGSKRGQGAGTLEVCSAAASWQWAPGFTLLHPLSFPAHLPYRQVFDSDDNKFIDPAEFKKTLQSLGFTGEGRPALTGKAPAPQSHRFLPPPSVCPSRPPTPFLPLPPPDEEIEFLFSTTDKDSNQMIDFKEV